MILDHYPVGQGLRIGHQPHARLPAVHKRNIRSTLAQQLDFGFQRIRIGKQWLPEITCSLVRVATRISLRGYSSHFLSVAPGAMVADGGVLALSLLLDRIATLTSSANKPLTNFF